MAGNDSTQVVAGRDLKFYSAPFATTLAIIADSAWGTAWAAPWVDRGYSDGGLHGSARKTINEIIADQEITPVLRTFGSADLRLRANLMQTDLGITQEAAGMGAAPTTTAASTGVRGHTDWAITSALGIVFYGVGFDIKNPGDGEAIRFFGWRGIPVGDISWDFDLRNGNRVNYEIGLTPDTSVNPARILTVRDIIPALP